MCGMMVTNQMMIPVFVTAEISQMIPNCPFHVKKKIQESLNVMCQMTVKIKTRLILTRFVNHCNCTPLFVFSNFDLSEIFTTFFSLIIKFLTWLFFDCNFFFYRIWVLLFENVCQLQSHQKLEILNLCQTMISSFRIGKYL